MSFTSVEFSVTCRCLYGFTTRTYVNVEVEEEEQNVKEEEEEKYEADERV